MTRLIPPGTPRWGAAWKKATVDNFLSAISGATRLFEEPGALDVVAQLARDWFERHLISGRMRHRGELQIEAWELLEPEYRPSVYRAGLFSCQSRGPLRFTASRLMKFKAAFEDGGRTFVLILDQGEEAFAAVTDFANDKAISAASVAAIGAFENAKVGWFDLAAKRYDPISVDEQCEVLSLLGDIAQGDDGRASLHLHAVLGLRDGSVRGGHFLSGNVRPTLEVTIIETASKLRRKKRADLGIALIDI